MTTVYGIGPHTARHLYARGLRTIDDLEAFYGLDDFRAAGFDGTHMGEEPDAEDAVKMSILVSLDVRHELTET